MEELLAAAAEAMNVPASMVERSAAARAEAEGVAIEDVLRSWASGGDAPTPAAAAPAAAPEPEPVPEPEPAATPAPPVATMDEASMVVAAAKKMGMPESMVRRSAAARAKAQGVDVDAVLMEWSGVEAAAPAVPEVPSPAAPEVAAPAAATTGDEASMIAAAAEKLNMPESMVRRSAAARAKAQGVDVDAVLMEWAGVEADAVPTAEVPASGTREVVAQEQAPTAEASAAQAAAAAPVGDESAMAAVAAEKMGMSESMVRRSAAARAKAQGVDVGAVLAEWAGVEAPAPAIEAPAPAAEAPPPAAEAPVTAAEASAAPAAAPEVEVLGGPEEIIPRGEVEPEPFESDEEAAAAGVLPRWLVALFLLVPSFAVMYALFLPNGPNCGDAGSLAVDPVTGLAVNCDGSEFGAEFVDFFALGADVYDGAGCAACHGPDGTGVAAFPGFTGGDLLATFPQDSCSAQVEWVSLGTAGWPDATYGANEKPVGGSGAVMPGFGSQLTAQELTAVTVYERVAFGGQDLDAALADCSGDSGDEAVAAEG